MTTRAKRRVLRASLGFGLSIAMMYCASTAALAGPTDATPVPDVSGIQRLVDKVVEAGAPGATMVVRDGDSTRTYTSGVSDIRTERVLQPDDRFRVGSITKTFVATLTLQLVDKGAIRLDAPVATYLPRLLPDGEHITVRQLLQHTSGLFDYTGDPEFTEGLLAGRAWKPRELVALSTRHDVLFPPGEGWSYSNTNYIVLGILIREVADATVKQQLDERIIEPLALEDTRLYVHNQEIIGPHAHGYYQRRSGKLADITTTFEPSWAWTAGALVSNDFDLETFSRALLSGTLLSKSSLAAMKDTVPAGSGVGYGLGLLSIDLPCGTGWGHDGLYVGYYVFTLSSEDGSHEVTLAMNLDPANGYPPPDLFRVFQTAMSGGFCGPGTPDAGLVGPIGRGASTTR